MTVQGASIVSGLCESAVVAGPVVMAIDGNSLVHRSFHAQARTAALGEGLRPGWAVRGLLTQLVAAVDRIQPTTVVIGFDDPDRSLRREQWPQYKANRIEKLDTLVTQLVTAAEVLRTLGLAVVVPEGLEADDVLASTAAATRAAGGTTTIVTSDRDSFSLIDDSASVLRIINGGVEASPLLTPERLVLLLGVRPDQYRDYAALRGDPSDNLPGVRGIGPRTAAALLAHFGTARAAFDDLDAVGSALGAGCARRLAEPGAREAWGLTCPSGDDDARRSCVAARHRVRHRGGRAAARCRHRRRRLPRPRPDLDDHRRAARPRRRRPGEPDPATHDRLTVGKPRARGRSVGAARPAELTAVGVAATASTGSSEGRGSSHCSTNESAPAQPSESLIVVVVPAVSFIVVIPAGNFSGFPSHATPL